MTYVVSDIHGCVDHAVSDYIVRDHDKAKFEQKKARLEKIAADLKNEDLGLEEALKLYEEGMKLSKKCTETLEKAELKVRELTE